MKGPIGAGMRGLWRTVSAGLKMRGARIVGCQSAELAEGDREQTRAEQHEAGRGQREKPVGHKIMISHHTPAALDAGPNLLKLSESCSASAASRRSGP